MKLSEVLNKYYVLPLNSSEIVWWSIPDPPDEAIEIKWTDSDTLDSYEQYYNDQEVTPMGLPHGGFVVTDVDGEDGCFIALDAARL